MQRTHQHGVRVRGIRTSPEGIATILRFEEEDSEETKKIEELKRQQKEGQKARDRQREKQAPSLPPDPGRDPRATGIRA